ncbi:hypothetical protein [Hymenobacter cheonanensis]|uniref:hypothetical protein n=1 Tax=Hymenobacter sp. CA2-7 TaxID=3063993 RepID=UPI00271335AC|nr:hypothetical protein [Hymenobacter sp. CA2-7]MDO7888166.1 hypothetical protein [Hymenobacter sp. CA2-7]
MAENVVVLRVSLDEGKTEAQLKQLVLDLEATRKAQAALTAERKAGTVSDEEFAKKTVDLKTQLKGQQTEFTSTQKSLDLYRKASGDLRDTYAGTQAQLSLGQIQFQKTAGSQDLSTESAKALSGVIADLRAQLTKTDEANLLFVRNIGNYPKGESIEPLIQRLVQLQEIEKQLPAGSQQAIAAQKEIGFQFGKVNEAAASAGLAQKDVTSKLNDYGERLRPVAADLAKLTIAQDAAAQSAGKDSAEYAKIGFAIGAARKEIEKVPPELAKVPTAADTASNSLLGAFKSTGLYSQSVERGTKFISQFKTGLDVLKGGFKGVQAGEEAATEGSKVLKVGLAEIGIGLLIIAFTTLVSYFTQSAEGMKVISAVSSALGATFQALTDIVVGVGKSIFQVLSGDFKGAGETVGKTFDGVGKKILDAAKNGYEIVQLEKELAKERRQREIEDVKEQSRVAVLLRLSKERGKTSQEQLAALKEAGEIEAGLTGKNIELLEKELGLIDRKIAKASSGSKGDLLQQKADKQKEIAQAVAGQDEQNAKIRVRQSVFLEEQRQRSLDDNKALYEARATQAVKGTQAEADARVQVLLAERAKQLGTIGLTENQRVAIIAASERAIKEVREQYAQQALTQIAQLEQLALDRRLLRVKAGSEQELALQREKLTVQYNLETSQTGLTLRSKLILQQKYEADVLKLEADSRKAAALAAYDAELTTVNTELLAVRKGTNEETELKIEAINTLLAKELASLSERGQNTEKAALLRARAETDIDGVRYAAAQRSLDAYLQGERNSLDESFASGKIKEDEYNRQIIASDVLAANSRLQLAKQFGQDAAAAGQQLAQARIKQAQAVTDAEKHAGQVKDEIISAQLAAANNYTDTIVALFGEESEAGKAALAIKKVLALAEIGLNLQKQLAANSLAGTKIAAEAPPVTIPLGAAYTIATNALAITAAAAAAANILKLQRGGIAHGPSHTHGGIQLYHQGRPAGIEIEGGEPVLTRRVSQNPLLLSLASTVNQLAGGRALGPSLAVLPHLALGGLAKPLIAQQLRNGVAEGIDYNRLAQAMSRLQVKATISDVQAGLDRKKFTDSNSNS